MNIRRLILRQGKPKLWLGEARDMLTRVQSYYVYVNISLLLITTYTVREATIKAFIPWFNFIHLLAFLIVGISVVAVIDRKWVYPSQIAFHQHQAWKHKSPIRQAIEEDRQNNLQRMERMEAALKRIEEKIDGQVPTPT